MSYILPISESLFICITHILEQELTASTQGVAYIVTEGYDKDDLREISKQANLLSVEELREIAIGDPTQRFEVAFQKDCKGLYGFLEHLTVGLQKGIR